MKIHYVKHLRDGQEVWVVFIPGKSEEYEVGPHYAIVKIHQDGAVELRYTATCIYSCSWLKILPGESDNFYENHPTSFFHVYTGSTEALDMATWLLKNIGR